MIAYFDTSALIPLIVDEASSASCLSLWESADVLVTSQITFVESAAALSQAHRNGRMSSDHYGWGVDELDRLWSDLVTLPVDETLISEAAVLAATQALRGYDAVQCATALRVASSDLLAATGDRQLLTAWRDLGLSIVDISQ